MNKYNMRSLHSMETIYKDILVIVVKTKIQYKVCYVINKNQEICTVNNKKKEINTD